MLDFLENVSSNGQASNKKALQKNLDPKKNPILKMCGIADVEPFANDIDKEIYGE